jgi:hypothetical protein
VEPLAAMIMDNENIDGADALSQALLELQKSIKRALGFTEGLHYNGLSFHVSKRFVSADLSPLVYADMTEEIIDGDTQAAIVSLYEHLGPLLGCRHRWLLLDQSPSVSLSSLSSRFASDDTRIYTCTLCTAYGLKSLDHALPEVGTGKL